MISKHSESENIQKSMKSHISLYYKPPLMTHRIRAAFCGRVVGQGLGKGKMRSFKEKRGLSHMRMQNHNDSTTSSKTKTQPCSSPDAQLSLLGAQLPFVRDSLRHIRRKRLCPRSGMPPTPERKH